jgi:Na+/proline symporter
MITLAALAVWLNNSGTKLTLVELLEMKFDMLLQIAPAFLIGLHWKGMKAGPVFAGMLIWLLFALSFFWVDDKSGTFMASLKTSGFHPGIWALGLNTVIAVGGSLVMKGK